MNEGARPALPPRAGKVGLKSNPSPPERSSHQERMGASGFKTGTIRLSSSDFRLIDLARLQSSKERAQVVFPPKFVLLHVAFVSSLRVSQLGANRASIGCPFGILWLSWRSHTWPSVGVIHGVDRLAGARPTRPLFPCPTPH